MQASFAQASKNDVPVYLLTPAATLLAGAVFWDAGSVFCCACALAFLFAL
jgi:hypothetical protein